MTVAQNSKHPASPKGWPGRGATSRVLNPLFHSHAPLRKQGRLGSMILPTTQRLSVTPHVLKAWESFTSD